MIAPLKFSTNNLSGFRKEDYTEARGKSRDGQTIFGTSSVLMNGMIPPSALKLLDKRNEY